MNDKIIKIINNNTGDQIVFDFNCRCGSCNIFTPHDYEDEPYILMEFKWLDFLRHTESCEICKLFLNSFGTSELIWYIDFYGKKKFINLSSLGNEKNKNKISFEAGPFFQGSKLCLELMPNAEELKLRLKKYEEKENYEQCAVIRDALKKLSPN